MELSGQVYDIGVNGKTSLTGPGGVTFTLHQTGLAESNPESGPIVKFLYSQYVHVHYLLECILVVSFTGTDSGFHTAVSYTHLTLPTILRV